LATALCERGFTVAPRGETTLVSWHAPEAETLPARLGERGIVVRSLPGTTYVRASVGAWNNQTDLDLLMSAI
jgi:L-cysteine/cystine lyase